ncbi:MAG TPA: hypothetical protein VNZ06_14040 [Steroidobacteraceae bacterium]|jgi:hypothetical protein|nr:hypothetical protein [Steroidobacteraceae bacterium]
MRSLIVYFTVAVVLAISIGVGFIASDWPRWCHRAQWCAADWSPGR